MNLQTLTTTTQIIGLLATYFQARPLTDEVMDLYLWRLSAIDADLLRAAAVHLIDTHPYPTMPTIENIREAVRTLDGGRGYPSSLEAWGLARTKNHRGTIAENLIDRAIRDAVGWHQMENATASDTGWNRKAFVERYEEILAQEQGPAPDVKRMMDDYRERIQRPLPKPPQTPKAESMTWEAVEAEKVAPKPLGSILKAYEQELQRVNPDEYARLREKGKIRGG